MSSFYYLCLPYLIKVSVCNRLEILKIIKIEFSTEIEKLCSGDQKTERIVPSEKGVQKHPSF